MSTSIHNGLAPFAASLYGGSDDPVDTTIARDGIANGLLHAADSYGQVRVNYMAPVDVAGVEAGSVALFETINGGTVSAWYRVGGSPFGEWPITLHADGTPYRCRVRIGGASSAVVGTGQVQFRVVLAPSDFAARIEAARSVDYVFETTATTSGTVAWLAGATKGSGAYQTMLELDAATAARWTRNVSIYDAVSSASPRSIQQCLVSAHVFASTTGVEDEPHLHALHIAEYVGT